MCFWARRTQRTTDSLCCWMSKAGHSWCVILGGQWSPTWTCFRQKKSSPLWWALKIAWFFWCALFQEHKTVCPVAILCSHVLSVGPQICLM
jgi:hypothetical protein